MTQEYIRFFRDIGVDDVPLVGGKSASLGKMYQALSSQGVRVPNGSAITAGAYRHLLPHNDLEPRLREVLGEYRDGDVRSLAECGKRARKLVYEATIPDDLRDEILSGYKVLLKRLEERRVGEKR